MESPRKIAESFSKEIRQEIQNANDAFRQSIIERDADKHILTSIREKIPAFLPFSLDQRAPFSSIDFVLSDACASNDFKRNILEAIQHCTNFEAALDFKGLRECGIVEANDQKYFWYISYYEPPHRLSPNYPYSGRVLTVKEYTEENLRMTGFTDETYDFSIFKE